MDLGPEPSSSPAQIQLQKWQRQFQAMLDQSTPYYIPRWGLTVVLLFMYILRVYIAGGWYIVTYALGIYMLSLFLAFLSPKIDPAFEEMEEDGPSLPTSTVDGEFKPFIRRLPEFKFWFSATRAILIAFFCSWFRIFDIPVFWPILLIYFLVLLYVTMKRQINHMIKYKYLPFDWAKPKPGHSGIGGVVSSVAGQVKDVVSAAKGK